jgi:hypothetical protein
MQKAWAFLCICAVLIVPVYAQEEEEEPDYDENIPIESDWSGYMSNL